MSAPKTYEEFKREVERRAREGQTVTQLAQWARQFAPLWAGTQQIRSIVHAVWKDSSARDGRPCAKLHALGAAGYYCNACETLLAPDPVMP